MANLAPNLPPGSAAPQLDRSAAIPKRPSIKVRSCSRVSPCPYARQPNLRYRSGIWFGESKPLHLVWAITGSPIISNKRLDEFRERVRAKRLYLARRGQALGLLGIGSDFERASDHHPGRHLRILAQQVTAQTRIIFRHDLERIDYPVLKVHGIYHLH